MKTALKVKPQEALEIAPELALLPALPPRARMARYVGSVTRMTNERVLHQIEKLLNESSEDEIGLFVTSTGGPTGTAMSFFDTVREVLRPGLVTIGSGDVDSSGVIIFMTGDRRYLSARTTMLLHPAGRLFGNQRYTTQEMEAMLREDRLKDHQYASLIASRSHGKMKTEDVKALMNKHTVLDAEEAVHLGLADAVLM